MGECVCEWVSGCKDVFECICLGIRGRRKNGNGGNNGNGNPDKLGGMGGAEPSQFRPWDC